MLMLLSSANAAPAAVRANAAATSEDLRGHCCLRDMICSCEIEKDVRAMGGEAGVIAGRVEVADALSRIVSRSLTVSDWSPEGFMRAGITSGRARPGGAQGVRLAGPAKQVVTSGAARRRLYVTTNRAAAPIDRVSGARALFFSGAGPSRPDS